MKAEAEATPEVLVAAVAVVPEPANVPLVPLEGAVNVTVTPDNGLPPASFTVACSAVANAVLICALCPEPCVAVIAPGAPTVLVKPKVAGVPTPAVLAATLYLPAVPLAVKAGAEATPEVLVVAVAVMPPPANVPLAPLEGAVNVTVTPGTAFPPPSFTVACSAVANAVLIGALCPEPCVAVIEPGAPGVFVRPKVAGVLTPTTLAVTL